MPNAIGSQEIGEHGIMRLDRLYLHGDDTEGQNGLLVQSGPC